MWNKDYPDADFVYFDGIISDVAYGYAEQDILKFIIFYFHIYEEQNPHKFTIFYVAWV